jgi:hypothetical protein
LGTREKVRNKEKIPIIRNQIKKNKEKETTKQNQIR